MNQRTPLTLIGGSDKIKGNMEDFNATTLKAKIFLKQNLWTVAVIALVLLIAIGAAVYLIYFKKSPTEEGKKEEIKKEDKLQKTLESLTPPQGGTEEVDEEVLKSLSAPKDKKPLSEEEKKILESLTPPK